MINIEDLTDAELRQLADDAVETIEPITKLVATAPQGTLACPNCSGSASWARTGRDWSVTCTMCDWNAAGVLSANVVAN